MTSLSIIGSTARQAQTSLVRTRIPVSLEFWLIKVREYPYMLLDCEADLLFTYFEHIAYLVL